MPSWCQRVYKLAFACGPEMTGRLRALPETRFRIPTNIATCDGSILESEEQGTGQSARSLRGCKDV